MRRTLLAVLPPLAAIGLAWTTVEAPGWSWSLVVGALAAGAVALPPRRASRLAAGGLLLGASALGSTQQWPRAALATLVDGVRVSGDVPSPYDPAL
ncbi:MAG: hypothetical protein ACRC50_00875, partial [Gaiella sp.]